MSNDDEQLIMGRNMMKRAPGKRQIKPTAYLLTHLDVPDDEEDEDVDFGATKDDTENDLGNNDEEESDEDEDAESEDEYSSDDSDASSSNETNTEKENDDCDTTNEPVCSVCLNLVDSCRNEAIVKCDKCGVSVHEICYGGIFLEDNNGSNIESWFCEPCLLDVKDVHCELCPDKKGAFKLTEFSGQFVHMVCALFTEHITWADNVNLLGASYQEVKHRLFGMKRCNGCTEEGAGRTGVASRCELGECNKYYHITLGLLVDKSEVDEPQTHPRFVACKAHKKDSEGVKCMKNMYTKFFKQENERMARNLTNVSGKIEKDRQNMKNKLVDVFRELQDVSITKPDIHCAISIRQRYARHIHTASRLLEDFILKSKSCRNNSEDNDDVSVSSTLDPEALEEEISNFIKRNKKLTSLKKKMEIEREKLMSKHSKKEAESLERKRVRIKQLTKEIEEKKEESVALGKATSSLEEEKDNLFSMMKIYEFPPDFFNFKERKHDAKDEKENPTPASENSASPSPKRRKFTAENDNSDMRVATCDA